MNRKQHSVSSENEPPPFEDFIFIAEFSEQIGPSPVLSIPESCPPSFNQNAFAIRVLSVDWHVKVKSKTDGPVSRFTLDQDVQMLLSEPKENAEAIVYYMTVYDVHARGNERPYCICYISQDKNKIMMFFEDIVRALGRIVAQIHRRNYEVFLKDLKSHSNLLQNDMESIKSEGLPKNVPSTVTPEVAIENITTHLEDMTTLMEGLNEVLAQINSDMKQGQLITRSRSETVKKNSGRFKQRSSSDMMRTHSISPSTMLGTSPSYTLSTITSTIRSFDRKLRTLPELVSIAMWGSIRRSLDDLVHLYRQDSSILLLNRYDVLCLKQASSLLSVGGYAINNFIPPENSPFNSTGNANLEGKRDQHLHFTKIWSVKGVINDTEFVNHLDEDDGKQSEPSKRTTGSFSPNSFSSLDSSGGQFQTHPTSSTSSDSLNIDRHGASNNENSRSQQKQLVGTNPLGYTILRDPTPDTVSRSSRRYISSYEILSVEDSESTEGFSTPPDSLSYNYSPLSTSICLPPSPSLFTSLRSRSANKQFTLLQQLSMTPNLVHVAYSMLSGKSVLCECPYEMDITSLLRNLVLFLPGSNERNPILTETDNSSVQSLKIYSNKLAVVRSKSLMASRQYNQVKRHFQVFRITDSSSHFNGRLYDGKVFAMFSKSYLTRQRTVPLNEQFLLTLFQASLLQLAMKAYLMFHHSLSMQQNVIKSGDILKESLTLSNSDWEIAKYFTKIIRQQILEQAERENNYMPIDRKINMGLPTLVTPFLNLLGSEACQVEEPPLNRMQSSDAKQK